MTAQRTKKEIVYDEQISPLMDQVIRLCLKHGISTIMSFDISDEDNPDLLVTTQLPNEHKVFAGPLEDVFGFQKGNPGTMDRPNPGFATDKKLTPEDI